MKLFNHVANNVFRNFRVTVPHAPFIASQNVTLHTRGNASPPTTTEVTKTDHWFRLIIPMADVIKATFFDYWNGTRNHISVSFVCCDRKRYSTNCFLFIAMSNGIKAFFYFCDGRRSKTNVCFVYCDGKRYTTSVLFMLLRWQTL